MFQPIAILHDDLGFISGMRVISFDIDGFNAANNFIYSAALEVPAFPELLRNIKIVDLSVKDILNLSLVNDSRGGAHTRLSSDSDYDEIVDEEIDSYTQMHVSVSYKDGNPIISSIEIPGISRIAQLDSRGSVVKDRPNGSEKTNILTFIGARVRHISFTNFSIEQMKQRRAQSNSCFYQPNSRTVSDPKIRALLPAKLLAVAPDGSYKVIAYQAGIILIRNKSASSVYIANAYVNAKDGELMSFYGYRNTSMPSDNYAINFSDTLSDLMLSGVVTDSAYGTSIRDLPKSEVVAFPDGSPQIQIYAQNSSAEAFKVCKNILLPRVTQSVCVLRASALELDNLRLPIQATGGLDICVGSVHNAIFPEVCLNRFEFTCEKGTDLEVMDLSKYTNCGCVVDIGSAPKFRGILFGGAQVNRYYRTENASFSGKNLNSFQIFGLHKSASLYNLEVSLHGLTQPVVTINLMRPLRNLTLKLAAEANVKIHINHCGIGRLFVENIGRYPISEIETESITKNSINSKTLNGDILKYTPIRKYKK